MPDTLIRDALILWATIDPIGTLAIFAAMTSRMSADQRVKTAIKAVVYASLILLASIVVGQILLSAMGIRLISLQVAGGIILFLFGLQMVFGSGSMDSEPEKGHDMAVFPLAIPSIASPGAIMAVILLTDNHSVPVVQQAAIAGVMLAILAITCLLMLLSGPIIRVIGQSGASILVRVMGMILAALSIEFVFDGLNLFELFKVAPDLGVPG